MYKNQVKMCRDDIFESSSEDCHISLYAVTILIVTIASILAIILLCFSSFDIPLTILGSVIISCGILGLFRIRAKLCRFNISYTLICLTAIALLLRSDLYPHQMGGQDQGLYVNMAEVLIKNKGLNFQDKFRQSLNAEERTIYDQSFMSSVPQISTKDSIYTIAFYPLHPIWMAISKWFFGKGLHTLSLLFFSALGIVGGYYLTKEIFNDKKAGIIAAFFLSVNPALVFFSKFPVGEIVAFAFSINGFLFLLKSVQASENRIRWLYWLIAMLCFNCFFYVRMQFFMYIPFFSLLLLGVVLNKNSVKYEHKTKQIIVSFVIALFLTFVISLLFYFVFQKTLFNGMVLGHLRSLANPRLIPFALIGLLGFFAIAILSSLNSIFARNHSFFSNISSQIGRLIPWLLPTALLLSLPSIFHLYGGGDMPPFQFTLPTGGDIALIRYHALYRLCLMLSPIGLLVIFMAPFLNVSLASKPRILLLFLTTVWLLILLQPWIPYLYYYARYLVSEMVPYSLIFIAGFFSYLISSTNYVRTIGRIGLLFMGLYFIAFSIAQHNNQESEDANFYIEALNYVSKRDIILAQGLDDRQYVPLRIIYGLSVFSLTDRDGEQISVPPQILKRLEVLAASQGGRLLILSRDKINHDGASKLTDLTFNDRFITNGEHIREDGVYGIKNISIFLLPAYGKVNTDTFGLYKVDSQQLFDNVCMSELNLTVNGTNPISGLYGFSLPEDHGRWSDGNKAGYKCKLPRNGVRPNKMYIAFRAFAPGEYKQKINATLNHSFNISLLVDANKPIQVLEIPLLGLLREDEVSLDLEFPNAISPKDLGISEDARKLGISIRTISFK
jgi:hypothetical protein